MAGSDDGQAKRRGIRFGILVPVLFLVIAIIIAVVVLIVAGGNDTEPPVDRGAGVSGAVATRVLG
ncbi:hypothetical protein GIS00_13505 [Nakamurella sp. YIM 132087]|uniref:Uncharacterized protein n=1 Tax=Nakamurella alba TaxID=2665158 RepID=A0A7K1FLH7_9ACTN|nr:hypothetical protein [Nakamurella alba]MTD14956.1 hypothetical protein [Nakamurella alba]